MMVKWIDVLLSYDFKVVYLKGLDNILPDALSRLFPPETVDTTHIPSFAKKRMKSQQANHATSNSINQRKKEAGFNYIQSDAFVNLINSTNTKDAQHLSTNVSLPITIQEVDNDNSNITYSVG